jgi:phage/plasmid-like protein (TIGR03299 family)
MSAEFTQGFFVRVPAWHGLGTVLDDYPGREEAMKLAGHDWDVLEVPSFTGFPAAFIDEHGQPADGTLMGNGLLRKDDDWKSHVRSDDFSLLHKSAETFHAIPNSVGYDLAELLLDQGFKYETGITLKGGKLCALTLLLDEPFTIPGDDSEILPYLGLAWAHDGSSALKGNPTTIRRVCANTVGASEAEGARNGNSFSIRHTKNWRAKVEDAKLALKGIRAENEASEKLGNELAKMYLSEAKMDEFIERFTMPPQVLTAAMTTHRVAANVAKAKSTMHGILNGSTIPEAHRNTGWGAYNAAVEYLDFLRPSRGADQRTKSEALVQRTLLKPNSAKSVALSLIREVAAA